MNNTAGAGKALRHGEKVLTPNGFINIEDVKVGDSVVTPSNTVETVSNVWPQGEVDIYRVHFQDGRHVDTCGNHLWKFHIAGRGETNSQITTTQKLKAIVDEENNHEKGIRKRLPIIPLTDPVDLPTSRKLPIDPYVLGVILGDGHITKYGGSVITTPDKFIFDQIENAGYSLGKVIQKEGNNAWCQYVLGIPKKIKLLGLANTKSQTKFIPEEYKCSSVKDRYSIVQGLMDTDGYVSDSGQTSFDTTSKQLCEDVREILISLGFSVTITTKIGKYKIDGFVKECSLVYRLYIRGRNQNKLFRLPRKVSRTKVKDVGLRIEKIELVGRDFATCIGITGEEKLFITTNYIVTHNSYCALLKQLDCVNDPDARVVFIRNTRPQLIAPGALVDESKAIYSHFNPRFRSDILQYAFPSGCTISFKAINSTADLPGFDGTQFTRIIFDEVQNQFGEEAVVYLMSRLRSKSKLHHQMVFTANPRDCWLKSWVEYCLDEDGVPRPGTEDRVRWFVRINNKMHWADTKEELLDKFPESLPISFCFVPATCEDNPVLLKNNPSYLANLKSLKKIDQLRLWKGSWTAREESAGVFKREWVKMIGTFPQNLQLVRAWDLASSPEPSEGIGGNPDYTVGVLMGRSKAGTYYILDVVRFRARTNEVIETMIKTAHTDGVDDVTQVISKDPGAAGSHFASYLSRTLIEHGITPRILTVSGHKNKLQRFLPFCALAEGGNVSCLIAKWNDSLFDELEMFTGGVRNQKDDQVDGVADATTVLMKQSTLPSFVLPDFSKPSVLPT